ncbi:hypothetical protein V2J09_017744 [Rumex salicifolius]
MAVISFTSVIFAITSTLLYFLLLLSPTPNSFYHSLFRSLSLTPTANATVADHLYHLTFRPHPAGTPANSDTAAYVLSNFKSYGIDSHIRSYSVLMTYPAHRSLSVLRTSLEHHPAVVFDLQQEVYEGDPYASVAGEVLPTFHAYAPSGSAVGPVVYVNYGRVEDYQVLNSIGINVSGTVVLARYGKIYRGDIVQNAADAGALGAIIYTDRKDYGGGEDGARWFPDGKWMPPSGVQVGTVYNGLGDPTTPGWPSTVGCERLTDEQVKKSGDLPLIPSLPISGADGEEIMNWIGGEVANDDWQGSKDAPAKEVIAEIQNVIGVIEGAEEPDRFVILGNHRDAWTFGAVDPNSGTAALLEVARRMDVLQKKGWKPRRTLIFCNWDAEEYGLIGSTEWVEENREMLGSRAVAYLNVDCGVSAPGFHASATPQLDELLKQASQQVQDPDNSSQSVYDSWVSSSGSSMLERLGGGGSDYAAFVQHVGIPSADMLFGGGYPVYHSMYDDFIWMKKYGDPMFQRHVAVATIWGSVALRLADEEFLPFDYLTYAIELEKSVEELENSTSGKRINMDPLHRSNEKLKEAAIKINEQRKIIEGSKTWTSMWRGGTHKVRELNDRLMMAERALTDRDGLPGRPWYKHLIYGPSKHDDYGSKCFPGIDDMIEIASAKNTPESWRAVQHEVWRVARAITQAALVLAGEFA